ncbi:ABC transporter substrate-binding protein [Nesterenkonia sp. PF2B19]|uniref:ABC transporter substrate-binding protein n=1 Tax=Nesterenkonia sp. PF2B19 TaxID=1881858 RepID=UPI000872F6C7|nr:ABC transporter substrate-binding protein [Nesterenkonia sp. PF2B19]OSM43794.1 ABC transporter substrate-binding protein [Nesterenkonia sp. PF2B19]
MTTFTRLSKLVAVTSLSALALTACGGDADGGGEAGGDEDVQLRFTWWGSDSRHQTTQEIIDAFEEEHPHISISAEYGDWSGYWDQLATQSAGNDMPDVIQMDDKYLREYADRGALLDLSDVDVSEFDQDAVDNGRTEEGLFGITTGINSLALIANPELFDEAGVELPDDTTWTWDDFAEISAELSENLDDGYGTNDPNEPGGFQVWLRQQDKHMTTDEGELGFDADDAADYFQYYLDMVGEGIPSAAVMSENQSSGPDQSLLGTGQVAMAPWWTNQINGLSEASGVDLELLRFPSSTGSAEDNGMWYKSSMLMSAAATTDHPEEAQLFIDFFVNSEEAGMLNLVDRGLPGNNSVREAILPELEGPDLVSAEFIADIEDELAGPEPVPSLGFSGLQDIIYRYEMEVFFERQSPQDAAENMISEMEAELN